MLSRLFGPVRFDVHTTIEGDPQTALWHMHSTARTESIAAQQIMEAVIGWIMVVAAVLVACMGFLVQNVKEPLKVQLIGWFFIGFLGLLGASEYMTQIGRMLRAGYFARQLEKRAAGTPGALPAEENWETFLSLPGGRLFFGYRMTAAATIALLAGAQFVPFLIVPPANRVLAGWWWILPTCGSFVVILATVVQFLVYHRRFPTNEPTDAQTDGGILRNQHMSDQGPKTGAPSGIVLKALDIAAKVAIIAGIVFGVITIQTEKIKLKADRALRSADLMLRFDDKLEKYQDIIDELDTDDTGVKIRQPAGKFSDSHLEAYIGIYDTIGGLAKEDLLTCSMMYDEFSFDINKACANEDIMNYLSAIRENDSTLYGNFGFIRIMSTPEHAGGRGAV